jgi:hypothetical protein
VQGVPYKIVTRFNCLLGMETKKNSLKFSD